MEDVPLIELDSLEFENEESWLVPAPNGSSSGSGDFSFLRNEVSMVSPKHSSISISNVTPPLTSSSSLRKKTLIEKIDEIANRNNFIHTSSSNQTHNGYGSPSRRRQICSTPLRNNSSRLEISPVQFKYSDIQTASNRSFDSRTFTRKAGARAERKLLLFSTEEPDSPLSDKKLNLTFEKLDLNSTYDKHSIPAFTKASEEGTLNRTYCASVLAEENPVNLTYDAVPDLDPLRNENHNLNATFQMKAGDESNQHHHHHGMYRKMSEDRLSSSPIPGNGNMCLSREESSSHGELDDALSTTSDSSVSHRLNDVGDVQHIAKLQEESLKQSPLVLQNQGSPAYARSATISPSSPEHSPLTEEGAHHPLMYYPPEEDGRSGGGNDNSRLLPCPPQQSSNSTSPSATAAVSTATCNNTTNNNPRYQQYSSQDSLPDSPYSSQSLDSQPAPGQDRLRRSMPNLNKIRRGRVGMAGSGLPAPPSMGGRPTNYGPEPGQQAPTHRRSLATMYQRPNNLTRGGVSGQQSASDSNLRNRSVSTTAAPSKTLMGPPSSVMRSTGIPRPGSRIPGPSGIPRSSGIPKPNISRLPTSMRKSSLGGPTQRQYN